LALAGRGAALLPKALRAGAKRGARFLQNYQGGDDTLSKTHRKAMAAAARAQKAALWAKRAGRTPLKMGKAAYWISAKGAKALVMLLGAVPGASIAILAVALALYAAMGSIFPTDWSEASEVYAYVTKKDCQFAEAARKAVRENEGAEVLVNGALAKYSDLVAQTDADCVLAWLYAREVPLTVKKAKAEIDRAFACLYSVSVREGEGPARVEVRMADFAAWAFASPESRLGEGGAERLSALLANGGAFKHAQTMASPFGEKAWHIGRRYGWSFGKGGKAARQNSIEAVSEPGTVHAAFGGTVRSISEESGSASIEGADGIATYAGLRALSVREGQKVAFGEALGLSDGTVAISIMAKAPSGLKSANPSFFLAGQLFSGPGLENMGIVNTALRELGSGGGKYSGWYKGSPSDNWCAMFVSWCAEQNGLIASGAFPRFASCAEGISWFARRARFSLGYARTPQPGDLVFFDWDRNGRANHVGVVVDARGGIVRTVEGNSSERVMRRAYSINSPDIFGYAYPDYLGGGRAGETAPKAQK
jgi:murein DD-endopeptidase MepM/ murein hydrolase activator NlpD